MKFVRIGEEGIGLLVQLPTGPHVVDIAKSLGIFAAYSQVAGALINGALKESCPWGALVKNWNHLQMPLRRLARTALENPDDSRLAIYPFACGAQIEGPLRRIVAIDITDAADLEIHDPTGRLVIAKQFGEPAADQLQQEPSSIGENVQIIDFPRHNELRTPRE